MITVAIVAALDLELAPLVRNWQSRPFSYNEYDFRAYAHEPMVAVAGGIGRVAARRAAQAMVAHYRPKVLISAGLAGSLRGDLKAGTVLAPQLVIDSSNEAEYRAQSRDGILLTVDEVLDRASKQIVAERFRAVAVDMEAAAVAEVAQHERIAFRCVKGISDDLDFEMPPLNRFVDEKGRFQTAQFALWAAFHPLQWPGIMRLSRNTDRAVAALCEWLAHASVAELPRESPEIQVKLPKS